MAEVRNSGTVRARPAGELAVYDAADTLMLTAPVTMGLVLPGDTTSIEVALPQVLPVGEYIVEILLGDEGSGLPTGYFVRALTVVELTSPTPVPTISAGPAVVFGSPTPSRPARTLPVLRPYDSPTAPQN